MNEGGQVTNQSDPPDPHSISNDLLTVLRIFISIIVLLLGIFVALSPGIFYAPVPKVVLYTLISLLPAVLP